MTCNKNSVEQIIFLLTVLSPYFHTVFLEDQEDACVMASLQNLNILILVYVLSINMILFTPDAQNLNS